MGVVDGAGVGPPGRAPLSPRLGEATAGLAAGVSGTLLGYPLDALKGRMQATGGGGGGMMVHARELARAGVASTYRGVTAPLVQMSLLNMLSFSTYGQCRQLVGLPPLGQEHSSGELWRVAAAGSLVALPVTVVSTPFELVKLQQQLVPGQKGGTLGTMRSVFTRHGVAGLYTGVGVNFMREVIFLAAYFTAYEQLKAGLRPHVSDAAVPLSGGLSGAAAWLLSFPLDTVKTAVQGRPLDGQHRVATTDAALDILRRRGGLLGLYRGALPSVLRAFIVSGSRFTTYEAVAAWWRNSSPSV